MATASTSAELLPPPRSSSLLLLLRLEGLIVAATTVVLYAHVGASWWLFAAVWLAPDLSLLGYLGRPCRAARIYNVFHSYLVPGVLGLSAFLLHAHGLLPVALIWANHIGVDRLLGYGLKYGNGFGWTHLGLIGAAKHKAAIAGQDLPQGAGPGQHGVVA
ncbi:MAG TPA: DUF4260 domain-containing protein [Terracidiphilus sp.]|jgi:hypothetical protein|nr:DUF4260 domain-containing protein [Terracidiphilus sp.]